MDNVSSYYAPGIKVTPPSMPADADHDDRFSFVRGDPCDAARVERLFAENDFDVAVNLAAQAGVRYSIENHAVLASLVELFNILEGCCRHPAKCLVHKRNEFMAAVCSKFYFIPVFCGVWTNGHPDMAYFGFAEDLRHGDATKLFNMGDCRRGSMYVDDIVKGVHRVMPGASEIEIDADGLPWPPIECATSAIHIPRTCWISLARCSAPRLQRTQIVVSMFLDEGG